MSAFGVTESSTRPPEFKQFGSIKSSPISGRTERVVFKIGDKCEWVGKIENYLI